MMMMEYNYWIFNDHCKFNITLQDVNNKIMGKIVDLFSSSYLGAGPYHRQHPGILVWYSVHQPRNVAAAAVDESRLHPSSRYSLNAHLNKSITHQNKYTKSTYTCMLNNINWINYLETICNVYMYFMDISDKYLFREHS